MKKCDVIIPVYNSPEWVRMSVYSVFQNTPEENLGTVILMNDNSNSDTLNCLENLKERYGEKLVIHTNTKNLGFVKNVNAGFSYTTEDTILLLNSDCILAKNVIPKLIAHLEKDETIGLICPVASNAANLSLAMLPGTSFMQMNEILEEYFSGMSFDACTVVGNCLMITRKCLDIVGKLDEAYGMGYGEETDYQFLAESKGFKAKVAIDSYVYHKAEVSFGNSPEKQERLNKNRELFFSRWGDAYHAKLHQYQKKDPIAYILTKFHEENIDQEEKKPEVAFFLPDIHQTSGGVHMVVDLVNYCNLFGMYATILVDRLHPYQEMMLFEPCYRNQLNVIKPQCIVGTIYPTIFFCQKIAEMLDIPCVNFLQGYEPCFENGRNYAWAELSIRYSQNILVISDFLKRKCHQNFQKESTVITNGIPIDLLYQRKKFPKTTQGKKVITFCLRGSYEKGDFILTEIIKQLLQKERNIKIQIMCREEVLLPINPHPNNVIERYTMPLPRKTIREIMNKTDVYVDASLLEGFGLMGLEAMAAGAVPIMSESFGIDEYAKDGINAFVMKEINQTERYIEKIDILLQDSILLEKMRIQAQKTAKQFDIMNRIPQYISYFRSVTKQPLTLTKQEKEIGKQWEVSQELLLNVPVAKSESRKSKVFRKLVQHLPNRVKGALRNVLKES